MESVAHIYGHDGRKTSELSEGRLPGGMAPNTLLPRGSYP